jgi:hypothetical protein
MHTENATPVAGSGIVITNNKIENKDGDGGVTKKIELSEDQVSFLQEMMDAQAAYEATKAPAPTATELPPDVKLAMEKIESHGQELANLKAQNVVMDWQAKKAALLRDGVPPAAVELAEPIMTRVESTTINLSTADGDVQITDKQQMLNILELQKGTIQFGEEGHGIGGVQPTEDSVKQEEIDAFMNIYGI